MINENPSPLYYLALGEGLNSSGRSAQVREVGGLLRSLPFQSELSGTMALSPFQNLQ